MAILHNTTMSPGKIEFLLLTDGAVDRATTYQVPLTYRARERP